MKKPITEDHILNDPTYVNYVKQAIRRERMINGSLRLEGGNGGEGLFGG